MTRRKDLHILAYQGHESVWAYVQGAAGIVNMVMFAILAAKIYQKTWVVLFCIVLSLLPLVNLIACIFMNIKAKEVINYWGRRRYTLG